MPEYGLRTRDADGNILVNYDARLNRHRYSNEVAADDTDSVVLSDTDGLTTIEMSQMVNPPVSFPAGYDRMHCSHSFVRSGTTFTWTAAALTFGGYPTYNISIVHTFFYD